MLAALVPLAHIHVEQVLDFCTATHSSSVDACSAPGTACICAHNTLRCARSCLAGAAGCARLHPWLSSLSIPCLAHHLKLFLPSTPCSRRNVLRASSGSPTTKLHSYWPGSSRLLLPGSVRHTLRNSSSRPRSVRSVPNDSFWKSVRSRPWSCRSREREEVC